MKLFTTILITFLLSFAMSAQSQHDNGPVFQDIVYLKDGSKFRGKILDYQPGKSLTIETWSGQQLKFDGVVVKKIRQELIATQKGKRVNNYEFRENGYFNSTDVSVNWSENRWGDPVLGASIANVTGYQFNRFVGAAVGVAFDTYHLFDEDKYIPVFAEVRGYLLKKNTTPMYRYQVGYGFGLKDLERNLFKSEGGLYSYPAIGFRFGGKSGGNATLDIGYKIQMAKQHLRIWEGTEIRNITYNRFTLRCGIQF